VIRLDVYGTPEPQGNKTGFVRGGRVVMVEGRRGDARERFKSWRDAVATAARVYQAEHRLELLDEPLQLDIVFRLPRPLSIPKKRRWPTTRPDLDKLTRSVLDALTGTLIVNDSRVVLIVASKQYADGEPPGCSILIRPADPATAVA
jgi:crossover junction endodeoxyribonuclease RusA